VLIGPLATVGEVMRSSDISGLSLATMLSTLLSSVVWLVYGVYVKEIPAVFTNVLGIVSCLMQLLVWSWVKLGYAPWSKFTTSSRSDNRLEKKHV
jgi:hypothetical protein